MYQPDPVGARRLIEAIISRRESSLDGLEEKLVLVESGLSDLQQRVSLAQEQRDKINQEVSRLKNLRDEFHVRAREIVKRINEVRSELEGEGPLPPDPRWARERLQRGIEDLEGRLETSALDRDTERRLMREMRELAHQHSEWVGKRQKEHPEWGVLHDLHRELNEAYESARTTHEALVQLAEDSDPFHGEFLRLREDLKHQQSLHQGLLGERENGPLAIAFWKSLLEAGLTADHEMFSEAKKIAVAVQGALTENPLATSNTTEESE